MSANVVDDDEQLRRAIELSKQTYNEEQRKRNNSSPEDLMGGDPDEIQRQRNIAEITALYNAPPGPSHSISSGSLQQHFGPGSNATLPYGFRPDFLTQNHVPLPPDNNSRERFLASLSLVQPRPPAHALFSSFSSPSSPMRFPAGMNFPIRQPFYPLDTPIPHNVVNHSNHSPIIVPFRTHGGNLIDLQNSPASIDQTSMSNSYNTGHQETQEYPELQFDDIIALLDRNSLSQLQEEPPVEPAPTLPVSPKKKELIGKLKLIPGKNDFSKQCEKLQEFAERLKNRKDVNVFFIAPTVDYFTTSAESIKFIIHRDETWPSALNESPDRIEMTYDTSSTSEDLLITALFRFLNPDDVNETLSADDYTLKLYGTDEFLEPRTILGKLPVVGKFLSRGKDVELMIGTKTIRDVNYPIPDTYSPPIQGIDYKFPRESIAKMIQEINDYFIGLDATKTYPKEMRKQLTEKVIELSVACHRLLIYDIASALTAFLAADVETHYKVAKDNLITAIHTMLTMYCEATYSCLTMESLTSSSENMEIRESIDVEDEFLIQVESIHNLSKPWFEHYSSFYVEFVLMYGTKNISSTTQTDKRSHSQRFRNFSIMFQQWIKTMLSVMVLPRETQACIIVYGLRKNVDPKSEALQDILGFASFPLFDRDGFLIQGKIAVPLKIQQHSIVEPWGPRPLIKSRSDVLIVFSILEYGYKIRFPNEIEKETIKPVEFSKLTVHEQNNILDIFDRSCSQDNLSQDDIQLLWSNRKALLKNPEAFVATLASAASWNALNLSNIYALLDNWKLPEPQYVLDLLLPNFPDIYVRKCAIDIISKGSSEFLINLIPQFLEALRFEIFEDSDLTKFLLDRSTKDRRFATTLYWELSHRITSQLPPYSTRCGYIFSIIERLKIPNFREETACQQKFMQILDGISESAKISQHNNISRFVQNELSYINDKCMITGLRLPINPGFFCKAINIEQCGVFNSLTKPCKLDFIGLRTNYGVIYKAGDDLRQDGMVLQLVRLMHDLWLRENLDLRMLTYRVLPTGKNKGLIELVPSCKTLREVQTSGSDRATDVFKNDSIKNWLSRHNASEFEYRTAFDNFTRSCAGWCVATYVLGIRDRHNDNILISESGHTFHIDFGKYMGDSQTAMGFNRDRAPFVLTPEMVFVINNGANVNTERFQLFADYCCKAYNILRRNCALLLNIIRFMSCSTIPSMDINSVNFVQNNLMLDKSENETYSIFTDMIRKSVDSTFTRVNFLAHTVAQKFSAGVSAPIQDQGRECFSFTNEVYTAKTDGRIKIVHVVDIEKWRNPSKIYMFVFKVYRNGEKHPTTVYRRFDEVQELYRFLARRFTEAALPVFDGSSGIGRTQVRAVAQQRQVMLHKFFQRFFQLAVEITQCDLVYTFFHAIHRDTDPEFVKDVIGQNQLNAEPPRIHLSLSVGQDARKLKIFISHARSLPLINGVQTSPPDTYVKTYLNPNPTPGTNSKRKTDVVKNTCNPTYNAHIEYTFDSVEQMKRANIDVSIWQSHTSIVRDNYGICHTIVKCAQLFEIEPDRRGGRTFAQWYTLTSRL